MKSNLFQCFSIFVLLVLICSCQQQQAEPPAVGEKAPDFCLKDIDGNIIILSNWTDKPVILRFWETDCMFCKADTPVFVDFYNTYKNRGLKMIYISAYHENLQDIKSYIKQYKLDFHVIMDSEGTLADLYGIFLYPQTLTLSPQHIITAKIPGGVGEAELNELIGVYLQHATNK